MKCIKKWTRHRCVNKGGTAEENLSSLESMSKNGFGAGLCAVLLISRNQAAFCNKSGRPMVAPTICKIDVGARIARLGMQTSALIKKERIIMANITMDKVVALCKGCA